MSVTEMTKNEGNFKRMSQWSEWRRASELDERRAFKTKNSSEALK